MLGHRGSSSRMSLCELLPPGQPDSCPFSDSVLRSFYPMNDLLQPSTAKKSVVSLKAVRTRFL